MKELMPKKAYEFLPQNPDAVFVDCRSGNRSADAARALEEAGFTKVYHILHGFEGDLDEHPHRNTRNGWRHDGLPWKQF